ncbi:MAG: 50S ribosomal protein L5 [Candidatus Heimdallarchaeota archaeon]|nr:50S ribosomal protein L5 [Candidatus Heimdallarchaeota archaeon]
MNAEEIKKSWEEQPMLRPKIEAVKLNVSLGVAGAPLDRAKQIIKDLTGQEPADTIAKNTWRSWGIRKGQPVGCTVTVRGNPAYELLMRLFHAKDYKLKSRSIDRQGNFGFGIKEHIDIPGMSYDPNLGIIGFDVNVQMSRAGYRVKKRKYKNAKIPKSHTLNPEDTKLFLSENYDIALF